MRHEKLIGFLQGSNLVSPAKAEEIAAHFVPKHLKKNTFQLVEGKVAEEYLFLETGFMRSFAYDLDGNEVTTNFHQANDVVFEVSSFFNRQPSKENIICMTDCHGWYIRYDQLNMLFHAIPDF